jgi:hypothetical protein
VAFGKERMIARKSDAAMDVMLDNAEAGDVLSQTNLATIHDNQRLIAGCPELSRGSQAAAAARHQQEALKWWLRAANQGSAKAQATLALRCQNGDGVGRDPVQALMWYLLSEPRLHGSEAERARKERLQLARTIAPSEVRDAEHRAALWEPRPERAAGLAAG